jgi:uncharacterized membrane protein
MKYKSKFLEDLKHALEVQKIATDDVIEYYDELIEERVAAGENERAVVKSLGSAVEVAKETHVDRQISAAIKKPTLSNGTKALFACLGVLSLPLALPLAVAAAALAFAYLVVIAAFFVAAAAVAVATVAVVIKIMVLAFMGTVPFYMLVLAIGAALILVPLSCGAIRGLIILTRKSVAGFANMLRKKQAKKGE